MTRIAIIAGLASTVAIALGSVPASAATYRPMGHVGAPVAVQAARPIIVEPAHFRGHYVRPRHHRHGYRFWR